MFLTLTLPSYGPIRTGTGVPVDPDTYDYRRAALDALHFPKLVDRFWQNLRRCAGYKVQYFAALEPQPRLAPHLHAAMRGVIPRAVLKQVIEATYVQVWWPPHRPAGLRAPAAGLDRRRLLRPRHRRDAAHLGRGARPARGRPGRRAGARDAVRHPVRHGRHHRPLTGCGPGRPVPGEVPHQGHRRPARRPGHARPAREAHIDRLHDRAALAALLAAVRELAALRHPTRPTRTRPASPAAAPRKAHDREHLGCGGRRVLVSRDWSGKTLAEHKADRATVVREALDAAGMLAPDLERMAAGVLSPDGLPRFVWTDDKPDPTTYTLMLLRAVAERQRWRAQYDQAKTRGWGCGQLFGNRHRPARPGDCPRLGLTR